MALGVGQGAVGGAVDGLVLADVDVVGAFRDIQVRAVGNVGEVLVGGGGDDLHLTVFFRLGDSLFGPGTGLHIAGHAVFHQVHGHHGEFQRAAALKEQDLVIVRDAHEGPEVRLRLVPDLLERLGAVTHLHDAHAAAPVVQHLGGDLLQHLLRHHGGAGGEIISTPVFHHQTSPFIVIPLSVQYTTGKGKNQPKIQTIGGLKSKKRLCKLTAYEKTHGKILKF